jgi:hypothetical protein
VTLSSAILTPTPKNLIGTFILLLLLVAIFEVLAVNQAYNFVVLNLGGRHGVEAQSEMLVVRDGTFIGKIRISSVEPTIAIGDIITSSLAQGVQVQPGDIVIYAGTNS